MIPTSIPVVFSSDAAFLQRIEVVIWSIAVNGLKNDFEIIILCTGINDREQSEFKQRVTLLKNIRLRFIDVSDLITRSKMSVAKDMLKPRYSLASGYRLFVAQALPEYDRVIYLDGDVIVKRNLADLYCVNIGNRYFAAVHDWRIENYIQSDVERIRRAVEQGFTDWRKYINAGVLLLNLMALREPGLIDRLVEGFVRNAAFFIDQDSFNFVCYNKIVELDRRWNVQVGSVGVANPLDVSSDDPWIIHYTTRHKPWVEDSMCRVSEEWHVYDKMMRMKHFSGGIDKPNVSIIIPVYNAARYLNECLCSVLVQSECAEIEVICVDDGSTDDSRDILNWWKSLDGRLKVIIQKNQGPGVARNTAMAIASGKYVMFLDADDRLKSGEALQAMLKQAQRDRLDILVAAANKMTVHGEDLGDSGHLRRAYIPKEMVFGPDLMGDNLFLLTVADPWAKLFRRAFLRQKRLVFPPLGRSEDFPFVQLALIRAMRLGVLDIPVCMHRVGLSTSLEATKDEDPLAFQEGEDWFYARLSRADPGGVFMVAAHMASALRYVYNLRAVVHFNSFLKVIDSAKRHLCRFKPFVDSTFEPYQAAKKLLDGILSQKASHDDFIDYFVEISAARKLNEEKHKFRKCDDMLARCCELQDERNHLCNELAAMRKWRAESQEQRASLKAERDRLRVELAESQKRRSELQEQRASLKAERDRLRVGLAESQKRRAESQEQRASLKAERDRLRVELAESQKRRAEFLWQRNDFRRQRDGLRNDLALTSESLRVKRDELQKCLGIIERIVGVVTESTE